MTSLTPTELTTLIADAKAFAHAGKIAPAPAHAYILALADALESLSATTPTEWEWAIEYEDPQRVTMAGIPTITMKVGSESEARAALGFSHAQWKLMQNRRIVSRLVTPWIPTETETP